MGVIIYFILSIMLSIKHFHSTRVCW